MSPTRHTKNPTTPRGKGQHKPDAPHNQTRKNKKPNIEAKISNVSFGAQVFLGKPGLGHIAIINPGMVQEWQDNLVEIASHSQGQVKIDLPILQELATISIEEGVHRFMVDQKIPTQPGHGIPNHHQKRWHSNACPITVATCMYKS
jgi:hypothetical protein